MWGILHVPNPSLAASRCDTNETHVDTQTLVNIGYLQSDTTLKAEDEWSSDTDDDNDYEVVQKLQQSVRLSLLNNYGTDNNSVNFQVNVQ